MPNPMGAITLRLAQSDDFDEIVKLSEGIYEGHDYLPLTFHQWLQRDNMAVTLAHSGNKLIGLAAYSVVDDYRTLIRRAARTHPDFRGQGCLLKLREYGIKHAKERFPKLQRVRFTSYFDGVNSQHHTKLLEWDIASYHVGRKFCNNQALTSMKNSVEIKPCSREYVSKMILSSPATRKLFPNNVLLVNSSLPLEPLRSNIDHMLQESSELFVEKCTDNTFPRSFSVGTFSPRMKFIDWLTTVYTDDPVLFEAHLLHQFKRAYEFIGRDFVFITYHDKSLTEVTKNLMEEQLQLKACDFNHSKTLKLYQRDFTSKL